MRIDRRRFLALGGAALGGAVLGAAALPATAHADDSTTWRGRQSSNGWPVLAEGEARRFRIEGSALSVWLAPAAAPVLLYVARRFVYEIESRLEPNEITGHIVDNGVRADYESTYLSGSGIAIRPLLYPLGATNGLFPDERTVIRDILADCGGIVEWGGDLTPVKESHFHITVPPDSEDYRELVDRLRGWDAAPGKGAGTINAFTPARLRRAAAG